MGEGFPLSRLSVSRGEFRYPGNDRLESLSYGAKSQTKETRGSNLQSGAGRAFAARLEVSAALT